MGPPLALFFPGLPNLRSLSPREIVAYLLFKHDVTTGQPAGGDWDEG